MTPYRILKSPDDGPMIGTSIDGLVTISRAELDALRSVAGAAALDGEAERPR